MFFKNKLNHVNSNRDLSKPKVLLEPKKAPNETLTRQALSQEEERRFGKINQEFHDGLNHIKSYPKSVTMFGSARLPESDRYYKLAQNLARKISCEGYAVITGGGPGIMEAGNRGAYESECNGVSIGYNIELPYEQNLNSFTDDHYSFYYFFSRKVAMTFSAEAYLYFPGGFGTLDELFEILTLVQTGKIERVPIVLVGNEFFGNLDNFIKDTLLETYQTIDAEDRDLYTITEDEDKILEIVRNAPMRHE
jgi:uncharacterized protein (TIGR00730 family)